ncbi:hypothetical protein LCGC14_3038740 [marine sediment metagenome]|uniref:DUF3303 domain-containing protein n=1 Tax=marine sediment metagenome TaxID=412755 RepID=A0A0F8YY82_9ZZZZ|nr:hypothetical protein [archaeon]
MIFITYWEINPDFDPAELAEIAQELMSKKIYPAEGVKQIAFYISTSDYWGIGIDEADSEEALVKNTNMWRIAKPGFIKSMKTTPAMDVVKTLPILVKLKKQIKGL